MDLTAEEKALGKENFNQAIGTTRRDFLMGTLATGVTTGAGLGSMYFGYGAKLEDPLRIGIIGTGDEGNVLIGGLNPDFVEVVAIADIRPYNIYRAFHGDFYSPNAKKARPGLFDKYKEKHGWKNVQDAMDQIKVYSDKYEDMLEDPDIEGVIIALPLWLHDIAAIKAMRKGKHVLTEKLMAQTIGKCKEMARVAEEEKLILATGHQRHYSILYANAVDTIHRGLIGKVHHIRAQWHRSNMPGKDSWQPPLPEPESFTQRDYDLAINAAKKKGRAAIEEVAAQHPLRAKLRSWKGKLKSAKSKKDIELWTARVAQVEAQLLDNSVVAEDYGYQEKTLDNGNGKKVTALEELIRWRLWKRTGAGLMAELGSHQLDAASIFISSQSPNGSKVYPLSVLGSGSRSLFPADREVDDHVYATFEFPGPGYYKKDQKDGEVADPNKKIIVTYSSINGNGFGGYGEVVMGTKGTLILEKEKDVMLYKGSSTSTNIKVTDGKDGPQLDTTESGGQEAAVAAAATPTEVSRGYQEEIEHWAWCIRNPGNDVKCNPKVAMADAVIALTTNIAIRENRRVEFKPEWFQIDKPETPEEIAPRDIKGLHEA
ncbi:MAG: Gfo/Idh/MocA family oxidoreductase [Planctomycetes bacterium]|nr:Gfo/Idh/MocA family oxidoreductase [Planctomycetota bacterium]